MNPLARLLLFALLAPSLWAQDPPEPAFAELIRALAAEDFAVREEAMRALTQAGGGAIKALLEARATADLETRLRIDALLANFSGPERPVKGGFAERRFEEDLPPLPLPDALKLLSARAGIALRLADPRQASLDAPAPIAQWELKGKTFFEALDAICERHGLYFQREMQGLDAGFSLRSGILPAGLVRYAGPLRIAATSLQIVRRTDFSRPADRNGHLTLLIDGEPNAAVIGALSPHEIPPARDDQGRPVNFQSLGDPARRDARLFHQQQRIYLQAVFEPPEPDAKAIIGFQLPLEAIVAREVIAGELFEADFETEAPPSGPLKLKILNDTTQGQIRRFTLRYQAKECEGPVATNVPLSYERIEIFRPNGDPVPITGGVGRGNDGEGTRLTLQVEAGPIGRIAVSVLSRWDLHPITVEFPELVLP